VGDTVRLLGYSDLEGVYDRPAAVARLAGFLTRRRDPATLVVGAGDNSALGVAATVSHNGNVDLSAPTGRALAAPFYEAVRPDAETFGNHDLDHGPAGARRLVRECPTAWLCDNVDHDPLTDAGVEPTRVFERAGSRVGVFGVTTAELPSITPEAAGVSVSDPVATARRCSAQLRDRVDSVVGLSHCGAVDERVAAAADADVVLGGHRHERHADTHDGTLLVRTGGEGVVEATVDGAYTFHDVLDSVGDRHTETDDTAETRAQVRETYERVRERLGLADTVARVTEPIPRDTHTITGGESRVGNFAADAYRAATDAELGVMHNGSLRAGPPLAGDVTGGDVVSLSPFGNRLVTLSVAGDRLRAGLQALCVTREDHWFLSVSGGRVAWAPADERFTRLSVAGEPLRDDRTYTVATQEYLVDADAVAAFESAQVDSFHGLQYDRLLDHARRGGLAVGVDDRIEFV